MKFKYKSQIVTASSKNEAIKKITQMSNDKITSIGKRLEQRLNLQSFINNPSLTTLNIYLDNGPYKTYSDVISEEDKKKLVDFYDKATINLFKAEEIFKKYPIE